MNPKQPRGARAPLASRFQDHPVILRELEEFAAQTGCPFPCATDAEEGALFEQFAVLNILRRWHTPELTVSDFPFIMVGTENDLQVDSIAFLVNEELVETAEHLRDLLENADQVSVQFVFQQATRTQQFEMKKMREFVDGVEHFLSPQGFLRENELLKAKRLLKEQLFGLLQHKAEFECSVCLYYSCLGRWTDTPERDGWRSWAEDKILRLWPGIDVEVETVDAGRLKDCLEKNTTAPAENENYCREIAIENLLPFTGIPDVKAYLGFVSASEYLNLLSREDGQGIFERIFAGNVRGFEGSSNPVNAKIGQTLRGANSSEFVLLNNGVTLIAPEVTHENGVLRICNYQVVNGLQTSYVLYKNRRQIANADGVFLPVKIVETHNQDLADAIILGTNQQTVIGKVDYVSRLPLARALEDYFEYRAQGETASRLWLERRRGQYRRASGIGNLNRVIGMEGLLRGFTASFLRQPHDAEKGFAEILPYIPERVLNPAHPLELYYAAAQIRFAVKEHVDKPANKDLESYEFHLDHLCRHFCEPKPAPETDFFQPEWLTYCAELEANLANPARLTWALDHAAQIVRNIRSTHPRASLKRREAPQRAETTNQSIAASALPLKQRGW